MQYKKLVVFFATSCSLLSIWGLYETYQKYRINREATLLATDEKGNISYEKRNQLRKEAEQKEWWLGLKMKDLTDKGLSAGPDLSGGFHVAMRPSIAGLLDQLADTRKSDAHYVEAIQKAKETFKEQPTVSFLEHFRKAFVSIAGENQLATVFSNSKHQDVLDETASDKKIMDFLQQEIDKAVSQIVDVIQRRLDSSSMGAVTISSRNETIEVEGPQDLVQVLPLLEVQGMLSIALIYSPHQDKEATKEIFQDVYSRLQYAYEDMTRDEETAVPFSSVLSWRPGSMITFDKKHAPLVMKLMSYVTEQKRVAPDKGLAVDLGKPEYTHGILYILELNDRGEAPLSGKIVKSASPSIQGAAGLGIRMQLTPYSTGKMRELSAENIGGFLATVLDRKIVLVAQIKEKLNTADIHVSGGMKKMEEAKEICSVLQAGAFPAAVEIMEATQIGPSLGAIAQKQGIQSLVIGLLLVMLFVLLYYALAGAVANVALLLNMLFMLGALSQLGASLTLPGLAGIVLTIGMSVDANVLIFERIREELRNGLYLKKAIAIGYEKAYSSIIDSNITTLLTGIILYVMGRGPLKGFATTLVIGIISSLFSAVLLSRLIIEFLADRLGEEHLSFSSRLVHFSSDTFHIPFLRLRKWAYMFSVLFIGAGLAAAYKNGLKVGIDFKGGRSFVVHCETAPDTSLDQIKQSLGEAFEGQGVELRNYGASNIFQVITSYLAHDESKEADQQALDALIAGFSKATGQQLHPDAKAGTLPAGSFAIANKSKVGAAVAGKTTQAAKLAILLALLMIFLYILLRFLMWQFGLAALLALVHDTLTIFATVALAGCFGISLEIDQTFVVAVLTVIGYSINDTVVVFDRIREVLEQKGEKLTLHQVADRAINETLSRTLITSFTTLMPVAVLALYGGAALQSFAWSLLVGIVFGTYSSIFIAAPLAADLAQQKKHSS